MLKSIERMAPVGIVIEPKRVIILIDYIHNDILPYRDVYSHPKHAAFFFKPNIHTRFQFSVYFLVNPPQLKASLSASDISFKFYYW